MVVDDNELTRACFVNALQASSEIHVVAALDHAQALVWDREWTDVDVALMDAADERMAGDQFPGVTVVRRVRACQGENRPVVVVVTGHFFNDGLRHRMAVNGADFFFCRASLRSNDTLVEVVVHPERYRRGVPAVADSIRCQTLGITGRTRVDALVSYVEEHGLEEVFGSDDYRRQEPRSRIWFRHRRAIAQVARIEPINVTTGFAPRPKQYSPSIRQLRAAYRWSAKTEHSAETPVMDDGL